MPKKLSIALILVGLISLMAFQNCGGNASNPGHIDAAQVNSNLTVHGTVMKSNIDGCSFLICAADNTDGNTKCFIPKGMDSTLLNDGNVVTVDGTVLNDVLTTCMAGSVLQVYNAKLNSGSTVPPLSGH